MLFKKQGIQHKRKVKEIPRKMVKRGPRTIAANRLDKKLAQISAKG